MTITTTGIAFLISSAGLAFCSIRFFEAFKNVGAVRPSRKMGILLSSFFAILSLQHGVIFLGSLFLGNSSGGLLLVNVVDVLVLAVASSLGVYAMFYIVFPKVSPWPSVISTFLFGLFVAMLIYFSGSEPYINLAGNIDWDFSRESAYGFLYLLWVSMLAPVVIFGKNYLISASRKAKLVSFILVLVHFIGMINVFLLMSKYIFSSKTTEIFLFDRLLLLIGVIFVLTFFGAPSIHKLKERHTGGQI